MASSTLLDLELTIISAKHLKNVNWRNGDLKPYVVFHLDNSDHRLATHSDDSGSTRPVWNERFTLPVTRPIRDSVLTLEIFHSKTFDTPKPLVGSLKFPLSQLVDSDESNSVRTLELIRPSGRPQGKIRVKLAVKERTPPPPPPQNYQNTPHFGHYYSSAPPPPSPYNFSDHYADYYYAGYYHPPQPSRPLYNRASNYSLPGGPSAPVDLSSSSNDQKLPPPPPPPPRASTNYGLPSGPSAPVDYSSSYHDYKPPKNSGTGLSAAMGGLNLEEGNNSYEKEKISEKEGYSYGDYHRRDY